MQLSRMSDKALLELRFCDLKLSIEKSELHPRIQQLYAELERKGLRFRPFFWISREWFAADGIPGIAVPFYLLHPRLRKLEQDLIFEVEGGTKNECMRILRHETGHAIDSAYRLHFKKSWREMFGLYSSPYPDTYRPKPQSRNYVLHLADWYAQAHPAEDFAETFAIWLTPASRWKSRYKGWPALEKLRYVDRLMKEIATKAAPVRTREKIEPLSEIRQTLGEYYRHRRKVYGMDLPDFTDRHLLKVFSDQPEHSRRMPAVKFIRKHRVELRDYVAYWTSTNAYTLDQVLDRVAQRSKELDLRLKNTERDTKRHFLVLLTMLTMNYIYSGHFRIAV